MARHPALVGVDLAGNAVTSVVTDLSGHVLAHASAPVTLSRARPGWVEADPHDWLAAAILTIRRTVHEAGVRPHAVGLSGHAHGVVLADAAGRPVRPAIVQPDARAVGRSASYRGLPEDVRRRLVNPLNPTVAGPVLAWLLAHEPASCDRARWVLQPKDWLRARLTGEFGSEPSDASTTLLYDFVAGTWSRDATRRVGLDPARLPEILPGAGHQAGLVSRSGAEMIGLRAGTPVAAGAARTAAAVLGAGLADGRSAQIVLGTRTRVVAASPTLPDGLDGGTRVRRAATDRGWCVAATVENHPAGARDIAAAVRSVSAHAPVARLQVSGADGVHPRMLAALTELVGQPLQAVDPIFPAARAAALLGARAAGLLDEESLRAQFAPGAESNRRTPFHDLYTDAPHRRRSRPGERRNRRTPGTRPS